MSWGITSVPAVSGKKDGTKQQNSKRKGADGGFLAVLEEMNAQQNVTRQDGFSARATPQPQALKEGEIRQLGRRIEQVNGIIRGFMSAKT